MNEDEKWMRIAINEANLAEAKGEVPVGSVIIHNHQIIAKAHNSPIINNDPTAHAEIIAIRKAGKKQRNYRLPDTTLYVTLEPCIMCLGAIIHARINRVVYGALDPKAGFCSSSNNLNSNIFFNHQIIFKGGILEQECKKIIKTFFKTRRR